MTPDKTLLLIGGSIDVLRAAKSFGLEVILIQHPSKFTPAQADLADVTMIADYTDWSQVAPLAECTYRMWGFARAMSLTDPGIDAAGRINDHYGLDGVSFDVARRFRDKLTTRRLLETSGAVRIGAAVVTDRDSIEAFGARYGYPFIVKPLDLAGGFGVFRLDGSAEVDQAWQRVLATRRSGVDRGPAELFTVGEFLMEEYVSGPEYSVESFSFAGRHVVVAVTEKLTDEAHFAELGHALPARIDPVVEAAIESTVHGLLDAIGYTDGPSHTEVRVGVNGPVVIESHCRIGGDRIPALVESAYGIDLNGYAVGWPFGLVDEPAERPRPLGGACVRFLYGEAGILESVVGIEEARDHPDVLAAEVSTKAGDTVRALENNWDRLGLVLTRGTDTSAAVTLCEKLIESSVRIRVRP